MDKLQIWMPKETAWRETPFFWVLNYEPAAGDLELNPAVHNDNKAQDALGKYH